MKGKLIIIEAIDGGGKDTQADLLVERYGYVKTRLPIYEYESGKLLRKYIDGGKVDVTEEVFQGLMANNYIEHLQRFILPEISKGNNVVMTRYLPSMRAYGSAFSIDMAYLSDVTQMVYNLYTRSLGYSNIEEIYLDIPVETGLKRIRKRAAQGAQGVESVFENEEILTHVKKQYDKHGFNYTIDGTKDIEAVHKELMSYLNMSK